MKNNNFEKNNIWWGPPRKFSTAIVERKISWLELFYDLVYVIVISRTTHHLAVNPTAEGILDYMLLFIMIFWGWINGSMYYDLHSTTGIRTRLMTLWQMMAVAALAVAMSSPTAAFFYRVTFALIFLQIYITYLWWSVGIYDKNHRKLNIPYTVCFLISLAIIVATLYAPITFKRILFALALLFNYLPPFISNFRLKKKDWNFNLSPSMAERLGLFTIIAFGEAILGVINGASQSTNLNIEIWECFGLGILILFSLWWIFFTLIADRQIENGFLTGQLMSLLYIPALASLGIIGATFTELLGNIENTYGMQLFLRELFGVSIFVFMISTFGISLFLSYPKEYAALRKQMSLTIISAAISLLLITFLLTKLSFLWFLVLIFCILVVVIITITRIWFIIEMKRQNQQVMAKRNED